MTDIVTAIYNLMGHPTAEEKVDDERIKAKVDRIFEVSQFVFNTKKKLEEESHEKKNTELHREKVVRRTFSLSR